MSHHGLTSTCCSCAILAAGTISANPSPTKINANANFTGLDGWCETSRTQNQPINANPRPTKINANENSTGLDGWCEPSRTQNQPINGASPRIMNIEFSD